jgi:hypothetical protein
LDANFIQWLVGQSGLTAVAAFAMVMQKQSSDREREALVRMNEREKERNELLLNALQQNTRTNAELAEIMREMKDVVAGCGYAQRFARTPQA